jgi:hypothetical protein
MTTVTNPPSLAELAAMPLITDTQYLEEMGSVSFNRKFSGIVPPGIYKGFDFSVAGPTTLRICPGLPNVAMVERDNQAIRVAGQAPTDVTIPRSQEVAVVLEAISQHGLLTKQIDKNAATDAAAIKVIPVADVLSHHVIICTVNLPASGSLTLMHISTATRQLGGLLNALSQAQADARYQLIGDYATNAALAAQAKKTPEAQFSSDLTAAPASGLLYFDGYKDLPLPVAPNKSFLQVMVDSDLNLTAGKCRFLAPAGETIKTKKGLHDIANLATAGAWFFFLRIGGVWKQL